MHAGATQYRCFIHARVRIRRVANLVGAEAILKLRVLRSQPRPRCVLGLPRRGSTSASAPVLAILAAQRGQDARFIFRPGSRRSSRATPRARQIVLHLGGRQRAGSRHNRDGVVSFGRLGRGSQVSAVGPARSASHVDGSVGPLPRPLAPPRQHDHLNPAAAPVGFARTGSVVPGTPLPRRWVRNLTASCSLLPFEHV